MNTGLGASQLGDSCVTYQCRDQPSRCHRDHGRSAGGPSCPCPSACALGGWNLCPGITQPRVSMFRESWKPSRG